MWAKINSILVSTILFSIVLGLNCCRDITFNNPLDPEASKELLQIVRIIETTLLGPGDIAFDGEKFWKINLSGHLTAIDRESGTIIRSFTTISGTGLCFFEGRIYICNGEGENILYGIDTLSGDILNRMSTSALFPGFLAVFNDLLIIYDVRSAGIFEYNLETGDSNRLFDLSGINVGGLAVYRGDLLVSDINSDSIYHMSLGGDVLNVFSSPVSGISGLAVDNLDYIYLIMMDGKIYKVSLP